MGDVMDITNPQPNAAISVPLMIMPGRTIRVRTMNAKTHRIQYTNVNVAVLIETPKLRQNADEGV